MRTNLNQEIGSVFKRAERLKADMRHGDRLARREYYRSAFGVEAVQEAIWSNSGRPARFAVAQLPLP